MKILGLCSGAYFFGKELVTLNVVKGLKKNGHTVKLFFSGWHDGVFQKKLDEIGIEAYPLKLGWYYRNKLSWSLDSLMHYPGALRRFLKMQKSFRPDVIYVDSYRPLILLMPFLKGKIVYHVNDPHTDTRADRFMLRRVKNKVDKFVAASEYIKRDLMAVGVDAAKITVVHNGIDVPAAVSKTYLPAGTIRLGIVGQVIPRKGHEDLVKACSILKDDVPFELYIYGDGNADYIAHIKKLITDYGLGERVRWMGYEKSKNAIYDKLDVLIAPTRNDEPFALVALESSAYKVPVVASKSGGFPESIIDNASGFIVQKNAPEMIASRIKTLYNNPAQLENFGVQARSNIVQHFTSEHMHRKMEETLFSV